MIRNKQDLREYNAADYVANKFSRLSPFYDIRYKFLRVLRKVEFLQNCKSRHSIRYAYYFLKLYRLSVLSGLTIPPNVFGKGLYIPHYGSIVVNGSARFGDYCIIQNGVNISAGVIGGEHIYLGAGCKVLTNVHIADNVIIGANAVLVDNVQEVNIVVAGIPAKRISNKGMASSRDYI